MDIQAEKQNDKISSQVRKMECERTRLFRFHVFLKR